MRTRNLRLLPIHQCSLPVSAVFSRSSSATTAPSTGTSAGDAGPTAARRTGKKASQASKSADSAATPPPAAPALPDTEQPGAVKKEQKPQVHFAPYTYVGSMPVSAWYDVALRLRAINEDMREAIDAEFHKRRKGKNAIIPLDTPAEVTGAVAMSQSSQLALRDVIAVRISVISSPAPNPTHWGTRQLCHSVRNGQS